MSAKPHTVRFFWLATLQKPMGHGVATRTSYGTVDWAGPATRMDLVKWFMETHLPKDSPEMVGANLLHWQCEPNDYAETQTLALRSVTTNPA